MSEAGRRSDMNCYVNRQGFFCAQPSRSALIAESSPDEAVSILSGECDSLGCHGPCLALNYFLAQEQGHAER
jgi:hypothetical protein